MKKLAIFTIITVFAAVGLTAQNKDQDKLKLRDGSCLDLYDSNLVTCDRLLLKDGSGSQRDTDKTKGKSGNNGDKDRKQLRDDTCLTLDGFVPQFLNLFNRFKK